MNDRGRSARRPPRYRMRLRVVMNGGSSFAVNVGRGGFCTEMMRVLPIGTQVAGMIFFAGRDRMFTGRVAWVKRGDFRMSLMGRMGIEFLGIDPELESSLAAHEARAAPGDGPEG
jgi:hypothetical protein